MQYLQGLSDQTKIFLYSFGFGFILGIVYDVFRIIRLSVSGGKKLIFIYDIVYVLVCAICSFLFFLVINNGEMRGYAFLAEILGWLIYYLSFGIAVMKISAALISFFKRLFKIVIKIISAPFLFAFRIFSKIFKRFLLFFKKNLKKSNKKSIFLLKFYHVMLYTMKKNVIIGRKSRVDGFASEKKKI